ncbi:MAG: hypothetical protein IPO65_03500 [Saprospiraceae bacterium]|nr:hypothetical protein [Saprospiraceae bacterium]
MKNLLGILLLLLFTNIISAQAKLKIYVDCNQQWLCDMDFLRKEFGSVDFVRDRFLCDVQIISNVQFNGNGGESNLLCFISQNQQSQRKDTLQYFNDVTSTDDIKRKRMLKHLQIGLLPYLVEKGHADIIEVNIKHDEMQKDTSPIKDPWKQWQFSISASGFFNGDQNYSDSNINNSLSAGRETKISKFSFEVYNSINRRRFNFYNPERDTTEVVKATNDRQDIFTRYISKRNEHWGIGLQGGFKRSIFDNIDYQFTLLPQVEYSILPYSDFTNRRWVLGYSIGPKYFNYGDTTIYFKTSELLFQHSLSMISSFTKSWGTINLGAFWSNYLDDFSKNNFSLGGAISWNVFKGFRFSVGGSYDLIHDQISLPKFDASRDDLLIQRRLIATSYNYFVGIGFSYTFGSIYNSQVNPTFRGLNYSISF